MISGPGKVWISSLRPNYDDLFGALPPDRQVSVSDLIRPALTRISDKHTGLANAYVAQIYEMQRHVIPQAEIDNGDSVDLQALGIGRKDVFLNIEHICLLDQENHLQARYGTHKLKTRGNHDITTVLTPEESREAGLNIFSGIRTKHPLRRDEVDIHGHQPESGFMVAVPTRIASGIYDDVASRGEDGATASKRITKITTGAIGLDEALRYLSFQYDANINNGHRHTLERLELSYKKTLNKATIVREIDKLAKTALLASVLWLHQTGALEGIITHAAIPTLKKAVKAGTQGETEFDGHRTIADFFRHTVQQIVPAMQEAVRLKELAQFKNVSKNLFMSTVALLHKTGLLDAAIEGFAAPTLANFVGSKLKAESDPNGQKRMGEIFRRAAHQFLPVIEKDPHVSLFDGMTLANMRPRFYDAKLPKQTPSGETAAVVNVFGCFIDGRATYGTTFADTGHTYALDWKKVREFLKHEIRLPEQTLSGNDLVADHFRTYGGLHPDTLKQVKYYYANKGTLSDEETEKHSRPPKLEEMPVITMSAKGIEGVQTPDGRPLVAAAIPRAHEIVRPEQVLRELEKIDVLSANNLRQRISTDPEMKVLFEPRRKPVFENAVLTSVPLYLIPQPHPHQPVRREIYAAHAECGGFKDFELA